jgi:AcrR family transcriptional regulator
MKIDLPTASPKARNAEATRSLILQSAEQIFAGQGFAGARVDEIAARAGYNKSLIFQYFGDKQGLYRAVIQRFKTEVDQMGEQMLANVAGSGLQPLTRTAVRAWIESGVGWVFDYYTDHPNLVSILLWEAADHYRTMNALWSEDQKVVWAAPVRAVIADLQTAGFVRPEVDPILFMINLFSLTSQYHASIGRYQYVMPDLDLTSAQALAAARRQIVDLLVHGLMTCSMEGEQP